MKKYSWIFIVPIVLIAGMLMLNPENPTVSSEAPQKEEKKEERNCLDCHRRRNINTNEGVIASNRFCNDCHLKEEAKREVDGREVSLKIPENIFKDDPHGYIACIHCHEDVSRSPHKTVTGVGCMDCHNMHSEGAAHAPHLRVRCEACHFQSKPVTLDKETDQVRLARFDADDNPIGLVDHKMFDSDDDKMCEKCHFSKNPVGAPSSALPPKSFLCLMCHNAQLKMGHWIYWLALLVCLGGIFGTVSLWFRGSVGKQRESLHKKVDESAEAIWQTDFSKRFFSLLKTFFYDIILQRRILKESVQRWSIHSLIYLAFLGRLILALFTMIVYNASPGSELAMALIDKNNWFVAFINDFLGLFILIGIAWAAYRRFVVKPPHVLSEEQDNVAIIIIGVLVVSGFLLEGTRIYTTGVPGEVAGYAFCGYILSKILPIFYSDGQTAYTLLWYLHALSWAVFIAWLPFGKLKHIILTPLNLLFWSSSEEKSE